MLKPALTVGAGAQRAAGAIFLGGGFLELHGGGFAGGEASGKWRDHGLASHSQVMPGYSVFLL